MKIYRLVILGMLIVNGLYVGSAPPGLGRSAGVVSLVLTAIIISDEYQKTRTR